MEVGGILMSSACEHDDCDGLSGINGKLVIQDKLAKGTMTSIIKENKTTFF